ncbi:hypothetical protein [Rhodococcus sp. HNM0569]|uniref:hypothetical protein n=1 Tax=Rhodococcus sp. HNM0569 TaxID=2716340 RepID=UPI00146AB301|nr:hypothetical protein [Rhodococcus sp. HNM0569]NLU82074.1 hypothetical protein [Rhodococcus sp. HNM0569]
MTNTRSIPVGIDLTGLGSVPGDAAWTAVTAADGAECGANIVRIRSLDLRDAQATREQVRADAVVEGRDPDGVTVLVDVEVVVAPDARRARREFAALGASLRPAADATLRYVGTPSGLGGLIDDIVAAGVADGVTVLPLPADGVVDRVLDETLAWLGDRGARVRVDAVESVRAAARTLARGAALAS